MPVRPDLKKGKGGFGKRVAEARSRKGLTLADLGKEVGVSGPCVWNWEESNTHPRPASLAKLAKALDVSTEYLLKGEGEEDDEGEAFSGYRDSGPGHETTSLADLINSSREAIGRAAGLPPSKVRITLDYD